MSAFPQSFESEGIIVAPSIVQPKHAVYFDHLQQRGYEVIAGLTPTDVPALATIATQAGTREYCPGDLDHRWATEAMAEAQLAKAGGRGVMRLVSQADGSTIGFGWTGAIDTATRDLLPMCENTFALRLHEAARGKKLGAPFSRAIVAGSMALWGARSIGLETWASNTAAVKTYIAAGAELVTTKEGLRPTRDPSHQPHGKRLDVRLYMHYPWSK